MAFIEPNNLIYGTAELPARLYGGLVYSNERISAQKPTSRCNFIPLHNTAAFHKTDLLFPHSSTCALPLCRIKAKSYTTEINRLHRTPSDVYLKPEYRTQEQNRNLLAGEAISADATRLWCVDDNSDRQTLYELTFKFDIPNDPHLPIRASRQENPQEQAVQVDLSTPALELRPFDPYEQSNRLFVRRDSGLDLYNSETGELATVYDWPLRYFEKIAYMDEIATVDAIGMVFFGPIGSKDFSRVKANDEMISVASTDSPAQLLLVSKSNVYQADVRDSSPNLQTLFDFNREDWNIAAPLTMHGINYLKERERIWHVKCVRPETETYFVTSTQRIYVMDRRMPQLPVFYTNHFEFNGSEYCVTGGPFVHDELQLEVYQYFSLSRILKRSVNHWAIGWNRREAVWTSMGPKCELESPQFVIDLCRSQAHLPYLSEPIREAIPEVALAMHCQHFPASVRPGENRALLFRQMNNGEIWFDSMNFAKAKAYSSHEGVEKEPEETTKSINELIAFVKAHSSRIGTLLEFTDDNMLTSFRSKCQRIEYEKLMNKLERRFGTRKSTKADTTAVELDDISALLKSTPNIYYDPLEPMANAARDNRYTFSNVVINMINKTKDWMEPDDSLILEDELDDEASEEAYDDPLEKVSRLHENPREYSDCVESDPGNSMSF